MKAGNYSYPGPDQLPDILPVFPLPAALLLPRADMPLNIFEPRYLAMIDHALCTDRVIGMIQPGNGNGPCDHSNGLVEVGCAGRITSFAETGDNRYLITLTGIARFRIVEEIASDQTFRLCRVCARNFAEDFSSADEASVDRQSVLKTFRESFGQQSPGRLGQRRSRLQRNPDQRTGDAIFPEFDPAYSLLIFIEIQ